MNEKKYPPDWHKVSSLIITSQNEMDDSKSLKEILQLHTKRTLQIEELYTQKKISNTLFNFLKKECLCDASFLKLRKRNGYKNLCCTMCVEKGLKNKVCICRLFKSLTINFEECNICGCKGCFDKKK